MDANTIEQQAANVILDSGVKYKVGEDTVTLRPLRFGTLLMICERVCAAGLTEDAIKAGENSQMQFIQDYSGVMLECVALAELNNKQRITEDEIRKRTEFYKESLHAMQIYELFLQVIRLSGIQSFADTIRLLLATKSTHLSPKNEEGS